MDMNMATLESHQNKSADSLPMKDKAAMFDQIWNDPSEMMILFQIQEAILVVNENNIIMYCSEIAEKLLGWPKEKLIGQSVPYLFKKYVTESSKETALKKPEGKAVQIKEVRCRRRDGTEISIEATVSIVNGTQGQDKGYIVIIRDVTEQKQMEAALQLSEEKFTKAFYHNQISISITRLRDGVLLEVNESWLDILGYRRDEVIGKSTTELNIWMEPGNRQDMLKQFEGRSFVQNLEVEFRKKSGEIGIGLASIHILEINGENCLLISSVDITERKKAEEALRLSEELFFQTFNLNPLPMGVFSIASRKCLEVNETFIKTSGYSRVELIKNRLSEYNFWPCLKEIAKIYELINKDGFARNFETKLRIKSGEIRTALISGTIINWKGEKSLLAVGLDITELRRYENELARLDRLNMIGQMAAGIGHEIRNPMTTVRGFLQLLMKKDRYAEDLEFLELMIEEIDRANSIISEFLSLAKTRNADMKRQSLNQKIRNLLPLIQADALKQDKRIETQYGDIPYIMIDKNQIHQLILNLVYNGLEAMSPGGCLTIRTYVEAEGVTLAITDQGGLIPPAVREKLGTPFFTTKERGTGLGLAVCYSIAQQHEAKIDLENDSIGTTFYVRFKA